ncbi:MAG: hypothetical protein RSD35_09675 [Oscillospiraceae bacterium]
MNIEMLDVVKLQDGRKVTVLEVFGGGADYYVEFQIPNKDDCEWFMVTRKQISTIVSKKSI